MPLTTAPSCSFSSSSVRSALYSCSTTARRDTTTLLRFWSSLMTLNSSALPSRYDGSRTGRTSTSEPGRNARTKSISTVKPPLTRPLMMPLTISCFSNACFEARPGAGALGLLARQAGFAVAVLDAVERDFDVVADADFDLAAVVLELLDGDDGFALQAGVDDHDVGSDFDDAAHQDGARLDLLGGQALFEQLGKTFGHEYFRGRCGPLSLAVVLHGEGLLSRTARPARRHRNSTRVDSRNRSRSSSASPRISSPNVPRPAPAPARPPHRSSSTWNPRSRRRRRA